MWPFEDARRSAGGFDDDAVSLGEEQAVAHDAGHEPEHDIEVVGGAVGWGGDIEDGVVVVGAVGDGLACAFGFIVVEPELRVEPEVFEADGEEGECGVEDLDGDADALAEAFDELRFVDEVGAVLGGVGGDFFAGHGAARALYHAELGIDLVGAVEECVDVHGVAEGEDVEAEFACEAFGGVGSWHGFDGEAFVVRATCEGADGA